MPDRDPSKINNDLLNFSNELIRDLKTLGKDFRIFEGYRSPQEQDRLFAAKKSSLRGGQSKHNKLPSEAVTIYEYKNNQPVYTGFIQSTQFKKMVNQLLLKYKSVSWGGNFKSPILGHFEIIPIVKKAVEVNPAPIPPQQITPVVISPPIKPVIPVVQPAPTINPQPQPIVVEPIKPTPPAIVTPPAKLIPASVKMEIDNSTLILVAVAIGVFFWMKK